MSLLKGSLPNAFFLCRQAYLDRGRILGEDQRRREWRSKAMARRQRRPPAQRQVRLEPLRQQCVSCGQQLWVAYHAQRTLMTLRGLVQLTLVVRRCRNRDCMLYHVPYRAEEEGAWALPH